MRLHDDSKLAVPVYSCTPGKCDEEDATVVETALREAEEEIGTHMIVHSSPR
jgi:hypothetical protein